MLLPNIPNINILGPAESHPEGYVTNDGKWAAVPWGKKFVVICNGEQVHTASTLFLAKDYIQKKVKQTPRKRTASSSLEEHLK
jgi:NADH:ubiquinone oxidoreductase subunit E